MQTNSLISDRGESPFGVSFQTGDLAAALAADRPRVTAGAISLRS